MPIEDGTCDYDVDKNEEEGEEVHGQLCLDSCYYFHITSIVVVSQGMRHCIG
ncbi:hypothetical protein COCC4DRAFT_32310 [Bipolaris maydis ATCC 48331]|uniref:Uncharacterized protein n=2 Tax=Cochliobolus heterostrophus TaxID=5016 RepID=M2UH96_COCH5|nr:uncharacterized protein COCC4DRAFT_32310 [Bipolaris maydis ATCC 48331]EMD93066.1 hypothetical protein COCHEDRAFT_1020875 [Bipolaris maydis C5]ENI04546.1 hypothetical protein COCC4DRAFT_32310 [Bipolaris maydis ATCC 48331]